MAETGTSTRTLREIRQDAGYTTGSLGRKVGVSQQVVSALELGQRVGRADTLRKIADALGMTVTQLKATPRETPQVTEVAS